nr:GNAT family N-acetyltransferase [Paenibacillus alvei]
MSKLIRRIESERMVIRPLENEDYAAWMAGFENSKPSQHKYDEGNIDMSFCTEEWFAQKVDKYHKLAEEDKCYIFGIFRKEDQAYLGTIDFSTLSRDDFQWARLGYTIHNQYWRRGYGKEAVAAAISFAFDKLDYHRIEAHINLDNNHSIKCAESVGMKFECIRKGFIYENDAWTDHLIYYVNAN